MKGSIIRSEFEARTGLRIPAISLDINCIVPLKDIVKIIDLKIMPEQYLEALLRNATLEGDSTVQPYKDSIIEHHRIDPRSLMVAQTFVERTKYQRLIENLSGLFDGFYTNSGFAKCTALIVVGETAAQALAIAHYLPPLIEIHKERPCLIDGTHRNFITGSIGTTIESIIIRKTCKPPCEFGQWKNVNVVEAKPPRDQRFLNLEPYYFRNLGYTGIDG